MLIYIEILKYNNNVWTIQFTLVIYYLIWIKMYDKINFIFIRLNQKYLITFNKGINYFSNWFYDLWF